MDPEYGGRNQPSSGRSLLSRLIVAGIIAFVGWLLYMGQVEENPVTHEKQHVSISPAQEVRLGIDSAPQMAQEMGGEIPSDDPRVLEVQKIGNMLLSHSDAKNSPWEFKFHLLADPETVNAFALPGGQIFITWGLLSKLSNEAELAGVLGHEMGHVIERHTAQQMAKSQLGKLLIVAIGTGFSDSNNPNTSPVMIATMVNQVIQLRYSRGDESEADLWGLKLMEKSGMDPHAMVDVMKVLKESSGGGGKVPSIFQTHPDPDLRIQQINDYLEKNPPEPGLSKGKSLSQMFNQ